MEEKKLDINSIIGFLLIGGILLFMLWQNQPTPEELAEQEQAKQEQLARKLPIKRQQKYQVITPLFRANHLQIR